MISNETNLSYVPSLSRKLQNYTITYVIQSKMCASYIKQHIASNVKSLYYFITL